VAGAAAAVTAAVAGVATWTTLVSPAGMSLASSAFKTMVILISHSQPTVIALAKTAAAASRVVLPLTEAVAGLAAPVLRDATWLYVAALGTVATFYLLRSRRVATVGTPALF